MDSGLWWDTQRSKGTPAPSLVTTLHMTSTLPLVEWGQNEHTFWLATEAHRNLWANEHGSTTTPSYKRKWEIWVRAFHLPPKPNGQNTSPWLVFTTSALCHIPPSFIDNLYQRTFHCNTLNTLSTSSVCWLEFSAHRFFFQDTELISLPRH